jgi:hypothetical protein
MAIRWQRDCDGRGICAAGRPSTGRAESGYESTARSMMFAPVRVVGASEHRVHASLTHAQQTGDEILQ